MANKYLKNQINSRFKEAFSICEANGLISSKKSAALSLGISPQLLSEVLNDRINVSTEIIHKFCSQYGYSVQDIFFGKETDDSSNVSNSKLLKVNFVSNYWTEVNNTFLKGLKHNNIAKSPKSFLLPNIYGVNIEAFAFILKEPHMIPLIKPNMTLIGAKVTKSASIVSGQVYIIENNNKQIQCRRLFWLDKQKGKLELIADNTEYPSSECNISEIKSLYRVISYIGFELSKNTDSLIKLEGSAAE